MQRRYLLLKEYDYNPDIYGMILPYQKGTQEIAEPYKDGYNADALHGTVTGTEDQVMRRFRSKNLSLLVATDVAARGRFKN